MLLFYLCLTGSGCAALASLWFSLLQDAHGFLLCLALSLLLAMLSEMHYRAAYRKSPNDPPSSIW